MAPGRDAGINWPETLRGAGPSTSRMCQPELIVRLLKPVVSSALKECVMVILYALVETVEARAWLGTARRSLAVLSTTGLMNSAGSRPSADVMVKVHSVPAGKVTKA